jgi:phospholipid/cholesterol/gamma-HCH transport system permease protein
MPTPALDRTHPNTAGWTVDRSGTQATLRLTGDWLVRDGGLRVASVPDILTQAAGAGRLAVDASGLGRWDSAVIVFIQVLRQAIALDDAGLPDPVRRLLALADSGAPPPDASAGKPAPLPTRVGLAVIGAWDSIAASVELVGETVLRGLTAITGRARMRAVDVMVLMQEAGASALVIVAIVNGLIGGILAFIGAVQLQKFGTEIYVADLVSLAQVREMAAVMTAIVMAGRTGGAYAAQIATMQGNEEIDALQSFGIPVFDYLVLPRIIALIAMMPLLYLYACFVGLAGGLIVAISILNLTTTAYLEETRQALTGLQFWIGLTKSVAFGALIAMAGCGIGLRAGRSAADVGKAATTAVVAGIIGVIALDAIFAVCANALGI